ncbi:MAG: ABC transporter substrate-binding protein [Pseudomonadota bacterium]
MLLAGALAGLPKAARAQRQAPLRVGFISIIPMAQLFVIEGEGWTKDAGLPLILKRFASGPPMVEAFAMGALGRRLYRHRAGAAGARTRRRCEGGRGQCRGAGRADRRRPACGGVQGRAKPGRRVRPVSRGHRPLRPDRDLAAGLGARHRAALLSAGRRAA